ncbi:isocitrate lyase/phosphoenolpyruvate mutase family protein [Streptomyces sp. NPDC086080]|uniref:isocitrate lyase/phosphoenolpyruvate mutase family protein n=1 Tax=Streptomyces sp. NPDC086080 TaxID=3365748 RepID=UPI0037D74C57
MTNSAAERRDRALAFRSLHVPGRPLILPNAWDIASARLVQDAGAGAVATSSAGVAWALGAADGDQLDRERALRVVAEIAGAVRVPTTADIESGYAKDPAGVGDTVRAVLAAGAVGVNIEDTLHGTGPDTLRPAGEQAERIAAARAAADATGVPLFVNARIDTFLRGAGGLDETVERADAYLAAGADGIFVPGTVDPGTVRELAGRIHAPLNVLAGPGAPPTGELAALGVARISVGSGLARAAYALVQRAARELLDTGTYQAQAGGLASTTLNTLMHEGP